MLSLAWQWEDPARDQPVSTRLANSLCSGIGGHASAVELDGVSFAYRALQSTPASARLWRPTRFPSGQLVIFHGYLDNAASVARKLGVETLEPARLYGLAVERWDDEAEREIIGEYCAVIVDVPQLAARLSRSPLRAPPLHYFAGPNLFAAASVPRALFAAGVDRRLNEDRVADSALMNFSDNQASWFEDIYRVPLGHIVELKRNEPRDIRQASRRLQASSRGETISTPPMLPSTQLTIVVGICAAGVPVSQSTGMAGPAESAALARAAAATATTCPSVERDGSKLRIRRGEKQHQGKRRGTCAQ